jgi:hypothetical protein
MESTSSRMGWTAFFSWEETMARYSECRSSTCTSKADYSATLAESLDLTAAETTDAQEL